MSTFQNILVSDTATVSSLVCDSLITNSAITSDVYGGSTVKTNSIIPYTGSSITMNSANVNVNGNLNVSEKCFLARSNIASQIVLSTDGDYSLLDFHSHSNIANIFPDCRILSWAGLRQANTSGSGYLQISSRDLALGGGLFAPGSGAGNLVVAYQSANIIHETYCKDLIEIDGNILGRANLTINRNANVVGNLTVGNVIIGNQLTNNANINCANINSTNGGIIGGLLQTANVSGNFLNLTGNMTSGNVIANYANINNIFIGSRSSYTQTTGTALVISQDTIYDTSISGTINGNVCPQLSFGGGREHIFATDTLDSNIAYYGISGGGAPDSDYFITYKRGTGMKISPTNTTENFTEALRVVGTANITGETLFGGNLNIGGNLTVNSDGNINNSLIIRSGFKGSVATPKFITYDIPVSGTHYFWDDLEASGNIVSSANINGVSLNLTGNLNMGASSQRANINQIQFAIPYPNGNRGVYAFTALSGGSVASTGFIGFTTPVDDGSIAITSGAFFVPFDIATRKWLRVHLSIRLSAAVSLTSAAYLEILTGTNTAFTTASSLTRSYISGSYSADLETISVMMPFKLLSTQPYFKIRYTGNTSLPIQAGGAPSFASYIFIEEVLCQ